MELTPELIAIGIGAVLCALVIVLIWPSLAFGLLLSIPFFKFALRTLAPALMESFTYDMVVTMLALVAAITYRARQGMGWRINLPLAFMLCWLVMIILIWLRLPVSRDPEEGWRKALIFSIFYTLSSIAIAMYACSLKQIRQLIHITLILGAFGGMAMLFLRQGLDTYRGARQTFLGAQVDFVATMSLTAALILLISWIHQRKLWQFIVLLIGSPILIYGAVATGSRGAVFGAPLVGLVILWYYRRKLGAKTLIGLPLAGLIVSAALVKTIEHEMLNRFGESVVQEGAEERFFLFNIGWQGFLANPILGNGPGDTAFQITGTVGSRGTHPHNQILDVANELGIFGLLAYLVILFYPFQAAWRLNSGDLEGTQEKMLGLQVFACFFFSFLLSLKSGSYGAAGNFFLNLVLMVCFEYCRQNEWQNHTLSFSSEAEPPLSQSYTISRHI